MLYSVGKDPNPSRLRKHPVYISIFSSKNSWKHFILLVYVKSHTNFTAEGNLKYTVFLKPPKTETDRGTVKYVFSKYKQQTLRSRR